MRSTPALSIGRHLSLLPILICGAAMGACQRTPEATAPDRPLPETLLIPDRSAISFTLQTDLQALTEGMPVETEQWQTQIQTEAGIDWQTDVQPWIGETITLAVVEPNLDPENEEPVAGFVFVAQTQDAEASTATLEQIRDLQVAEDGAEFEQRRQDQVQLWIETTGALGERMVLASIGESYIAIANDLTVMEETIARFQQGEDSGALGQDPEFTAMVSDLWQPETLVFGYLNPETFFTPELAADYDFDLSPTSMEGLRGVGVVGQQQPEGWLIRAQANVDPDSSWGSIAADTVSGEVIERLPGNALAVISGQAIAQSWQRNLETVGQDPEAASGLEMMRQMFRAGTTLDLDEDVIGWMDGEFAVVLLEDPTAHPFLQGLGGMVVLQSSQPERATAALEQLDSRVGQTGAQVTSESDQVIWQDPLLGRPLVNRSWQEDYLVISTNESSQSIFAGETGGTLPETEPFKTLIESLPQPNYGYVLINGQGMIDLVEANQPGSLESMDPEARETARKLEGLGVTSYPFDQDSYRMDLLLMMSADESQDESQ